MLFGLLKRYIKAHQAISITLILFFSMSAFFLSVGTKVIYDINRSVMHLSEVAITPDFVQMQSGEIDQAQFLEFDKKYSAQIKSSQIVKMLSITNDNLFIASKNNSESQENSLMDVGLVFQNSNFDFLLDPHLELPKLGSSEIGIPIYYRDKYDLKLGQFVWINIDGKMEQFKIVTFIVDSEMNSSFASSKRLLISKDDFVRLSQKNFGSEYLIEYLLTDPSQVSEFQVAYNKEEMPNSGPTLTKSLFVLLNTISSGIEGISYIFMSVVVSIIALLCVRFSVMLSLVEDRKEIATLRAIGFRNRFIKKLYLVRYLGFVLISLLIGFVFSLIVSDLLLSAIDSFGVVPGLDLKGYVYQLFILLLIPLLVYFVVELSLRRMTKITIIDGLKDTDNSGLNRSIRIRFSEFPRLPNNAFLALNYVLTNVKISFSLCVIFSISLFISIVPINFYQTLKSNEFAEYFGVGDVDVLAILNAGPSRVELEVLLRSYMELNDNIQEHAKTFISNINTKNSSGEIGELQVTTGDINTFQLKYTEGKAPTETNEIALSYLSAEDLQKKVGDQISVGFGSKDFHSFVVSGIYQDITNGGKTARALFTAPEDKYLWENLAFKYKPNTDIQKEVHKISSLNGSIQVAEVQKYVEQTLGNIIPVLKQSSIIAFLVNIILVIVISNLYISILLKLNANDNATLYFIGISIKDLIRQYNIVVILISIPSMIIGALLSALLSNPLINLFVNNLGIADLTLSSNPFLVYFLIPIVVCIGAYFSVAFSLRRQRTKVFIGREIG